MIRCRIFIYRLLLFLCSRKQEASMSNRLLSLIAAFGLALAASASQAMPVAADNAAVSSAPIILAAEGCGPDRVRGPEGHCHAIVRHGVAVVAPMPYWRGPGWRFSGGCWRGPHGGVHCG